MLEELLPAPVAVRETFDPPVRSEGALYPEEEALLVRAVDKRRREFLGSRTCARRALAALGLPPAPVLPGATGAPSWPAGVVGSMTHRAGYCAAAVAHAAHVLSLGIDAEENAPLPRQVLETVAVEEERGWAVHGGRGSAVHGDRGDHGDWDGRGDWGGASDVCLDRLLFSAKESVFKAWSPLTGAPLGFREVAVELSPPREPGGAGAFRARLRIAPPLVGGRELREFSGRWLARDGLLLTAVAAPRAA
ncbi:4'-phosphopantetheinyl transferase superfamily protein [Streptomyces sp. ODS28]|uniref:4'-phosphopantetheinyl transferase family protein n=1 Tax=Streptomyces sp. ODS28 TaxID=3136688 RepID=UPI0031E8AC48